MVLKFQKMLFYKKFRSLWIKPKYIECLNKGHTYKKIFNASNNVRPIIIGKIFVISADIVRGFTVE